MTDAFVGIDISESGLALAVYQSDYRFECPIDPSLPNPSTPDKLIDEVKKLQPKLIALESRIGNEIPIAAALYAAGLPTVVINKTAIDRFAQKDFVDGNRAQ